MKIKITEDQAKRLRLITEDISPIEKYEGFCIKMIESINKLYLKVNTFTIGEIINNEINISELNNFLSQIEDKVLDGNRVLYKYINNLPDEDLDIRIDNAYTSVRDKLNPLQVILLDLEKIQTSNKNKGLTKPFDDVKSLNI